MALEIERRFLVRLEDYKEMQQYIGNNKYTCLSIDQGYLKMADPSMVFRVRTIHDFPNTSGYLTIKYPTAKVGITNELEYPIPMKDALALLTRADGIISKTRYVVSIDNGLKWELDAFLRKAYGIIIAEIELPHINTEIFLPSFIGPEITGIKELSNFNICMDTAAAFSKIKEILDEQSNKKTSSRTTAESQS